ncbi:MAG TPA: sterol desaturase family protein, partial [Ferruginibacter sp.]|nr:sterol desaturase family protein [Ferruginibacter sp.]
SSEEFNLACALRQSISVFVRLFVLLLLPAALLGIEPAVIAVVGPLHLFAQFWYHTRHIGKMGFLEKVIVTPSHHRVHHAINPEYLDKNYSQIFIIWDKLFGTFQEELPGVPPVYGITRPVRTWNPIKINFQHFWLLVKDAWRTRNWKDKFRIWFMPTGWRPSDVAESYPVEKINDVYQFEKYDTPYSKPFLAWTWFQLLMLLVCISYLFGQIADIGMPGMLYYGLFVFLSVYALTDLMDRQASSLFTGIIRDLTGIILVYFQSDWLAGAQLGQPVQMYMYAYFILSLSGTIYFYLEHRKGQ